jgi:hypothetical protein
VRAISIFLTTCLFFSFALSKDKADQAGQAGRSSGDHRAKWVIMIYVEADEILNAFAVKNFNAIAQIGSTKDVQIIVQWNQPRKKGTWRYLIEKKKMTLIDKKIETKQRILKNDLIEFAQFTESNFPAENYVFILWNHGLGVLEPPWEELPYFFIRSALLARYPEIKIKGILYDLRNRKCLSSSELKEAFSYITKNILQKKFALIGMDACLMAMLEVAFQIRNYADYFVASEEVELAQGWSYMPFVKALVESPSMGARELSKKIVAAFKRRYENKTRFYSLSAIDLKIVEEIKENLDEIVGEIVKTVGKTAGKTAVEKARKSCFQLSVPSYVDLHSFYQALETELEKNTTNTSNKKLKTKIRSGIKIIEKAVFHNATSEYFSRARGISIYFPEPTKQITKSQNIPFIDPSYLKTSFAKKSGWLRFLKKNVCF